MSKKEIKVCLNCAQPLHTQENLGITLPYCMNKKCPRYGLVTVVVGYESD
jgi:hypothetical protein